MQVVKMGVTYEYVIDWRKITQPEAGAPLPLEQYQPAREIRIDHQIASANLDKKPAMPNKRKS
jgi:hypothetical protein